jgi:hypothetical protein
MNEYVFEMKICPHCKLEKVRYIYFAPKGKHCRECQKEFYTKCKKKLARDPKMRWQPLYLSKRKPFDWEAI